MNTSPVPNTVQIKGAVVAIIVFIAFVLITGSFVVVDSGFVGVVRTLGRVHPVSIPEGFHLKKPFVDKVEQIDIRLKRTLTNTTSSSKDLQQVRTQVTIQYSIDGTLAPKTYQRIGVGGVVATTVIEPAIQESVKAIAAKYTAEQLITERAQVKLKIQE
ncbi:MAG: hypothetical protein KDD53_05975, partial [Bdellovibrionales bacterium]|nr:hypothetical protein [Bdellovibrionales bacterium]